LADLLLRLIFTSALPKTSTRPSFAGADNKGAQPPVQMHKKVRRTMNRRAIHNI
jgi:hypothetical protein